MSEGSSLTEFGENPVIPNKSPGLFGTIKNFIETRNQEKQAVDENTRIIERLSSLGERLSNLLDSTEFKASEKNYTNWQDGKSWVNHISSASLGKLLYYISVGRDRSDKATHVWFNVRGEHPDFSKTENSTFPTSSHEGNCMISFYPESSSSQRTKKTKYSVDAKIDGDLLLGEDFEFIKEASINNRETHIDLHEISFGGYPVVFLSFASWGEKIKNQERLGPSGRVRQMHIFSLGRKLVIPKGSDVMESDSLDININEGLPDTHIPLQMERGEMDIIVSKRGNILGILATGIRKHLNPANRDKPLEGEREKIEYQIPLDQVKTGQILDKIEKAVGDFELACKS